MTAGTVIVGASVAGIGTATELRRLGYDAPITLIDAQPHLPYDRPPLSKAMLTGQADAAAIAFHQREHYAEIALDIRTGVTATALDVGGRRVLLGNGSSIHAESVLIATGARARPFHPAGNGAAVRTVRELDDALALAPRLVPGARVAVIGGGFIGAEVASSARQLGCEVTIIEAARLPFEALLGPEVAGMLAELHKAAGTRLRCGATVVRAEPLAGAADSAAGQRLVLSNGEVIDADVVVAGLGAIPNAEWLARSGLVTDGTVHCDAHGRAAPGIWAAGDIATWPDPSSGVARRHEHWTSAREQARIVAHDIAGVAGPTWADMVPYVWSDQYGKRIQVLGTPAGTDAVKVVEHDPARLSFLAVYGRAGRLAAVAGCGAAGKLMRYRPKLAYGGSSFSEDSALRGGPALSPLGSGRPASPHP
jgi:NADPH-dependent 2,4-dienoyl-CoA reductase/sulfur reductase-like enzyme